MGSVDVCWIPKRRVWIKWCKLVLTFIKQLVLFLFARAFIMVPEVWYKTVRKCGFGKHHFKSVTVIFVLASIGFVAIISSKLSYRNPVFESHPMVQLIQGQGRVHIQDLQVYKDLPNQDDESYLMMNKARESIRTLVEECQKYKEENVCDFKEENGEKLLTLFTTWTFKTDKFSVNNRTLHNWKMLPSVNLVVFVGPNDTEVMNYSRNAGWDVMHISKHASGAPVLPNMFMDAMHKYKSKFYGYANADILFTDDFTETLKQIYCKIKFKDTPIDVSSGLLLVGRRMNVPTAFLDDKTVVTWPKLRKVTYQYGKLFQTDAEDYFITDSSYPWKSVVPVVVGRVAVDNWIVAYSRMLNITAIDATESILAVHQTLQERGNWESKDSGNYNIDLIKTLNLPIVYGWGRTECTQYKSWFDLCGRLLIKKRTAFDEDCSSSERT